MALVTLVSHVFASLTGVSRLFGDVAGLGKSPLGHNGTKDLVNQNCEENNESYNACNTGIDDLIACNGAYHTQSNTCLGEEGNTEVFNYIRGAFGHLCGSHSTEIFTDTTGKDVYNTNENQKGLCKYAQVKLCAAYNEEENEKRLAPAVGTVHHFIGAFADVTEDGSAHHTGQKR